MNRQTGKAIRITIGCILLSGCFSGCNKKRENVPPETFSQTFPEPIAAGPPVIQPNKNRGFDRIARFLAGMAPDSVDPLASIEGTDAWKNFQQKIDSKWRQFDQGHLKLIRQFAESELQVSKTKGLVFYPFSGPDFLYVNTFFPDADRFILFGLEPPGPLPDPLIIPPDSLVGFLNNVRQSLDDVLSVSFFKTNDMKIDLKEKLQGNLTVLLFLLARSNQRILDVKPIRIDSSGTVAACDTFYTSPEGYYNHGVEIRFCWNGNDSIRSLIYFSTDISDYGLKKNPNTRRFLQRLDTSFATYIKAASYLMHKKYFTVIRNTILAKSDVILQDDSGVPFKLFDPEVWDITLYGKYSRPIELFKDYFEEDLFAAYQKSSQPLLFHIGYNSESNLLFAVRKKQ